MTAPLAPATKLSRPTGRPVTAILPTGGSTVDARPRSPEALAYDPPTVPLRKSRRGGKARVTESIAAEGALPLAVRHEHERREALGRVALK